MRRTPVLAAVAGLALAPIANGYPTTVVHDDTDGCDVLSVPNEVHELGEEPTFTPFPSERISATFTVTDQAACPSTDGDGANVVLVITNLTDIAWSDLWYVGDTAATAPITTLSNDDGIVNGGLAFKIDSLGVNRPLFAESIASDGIFAPGEVWSFIIDDYRSPPALPLGFPPDLLDSIGVGSFSAGGNSTGSIIAIQRDLPEPAALGLLALGIGLFGARRAIG